MTKLIEVSHARKRGASVGMIIPKKILEKLRIEAEGIVGFYEIRGEIVIRRIE